MFAETAYLFRHGVLRDCAYGLQLPSERGRLHQLALGILEEVTPEAGLDAIAAELADHALAATITSDDPRATAGPWSLAGPNRALRERELKWLARAATALGRSLDVPALRVLARRILDHPLADAEGRARGCFALAKALRNLGLSRDAETELVSGLGQGDLPARLRCELLLELGDCRRMLGRADEARQALDQATPLAEAEGDQPLRANMLRKLGLLLSQQGRLSEAVESLQQAVRISMQLGDIHTEATGRGNLGLVQVDLGQLAEAETNLLRAVAICESGANDWYLGPALTNLAVLLERQARAEEAQATYARGLAAYVRVGNRRGEAIARYNVGSGHMKARRNAQAEAEFRRSHELARESGDALFTCRAAGMVATMRHRADDRAARDQWIEQALAQARSIADDRIIAAMLYHRGEFALDDRNPAQALADFEQADPLHQRMNNQRGLLSGRISMAEAKHALGRTQEARELIESVRQAAQAAGQHEIASDCDEVLAKFDAVKA